MMSPTPPGPLSPDGRGCRRKPCSCTDPPSIGRCGGSSRDPGCWDQASRDERPDERGEEGVPAPTSVVHDLEEGEIERKLFLRDAAMGPQPGAQQRPDP